MNLLFRVGGIDKLPEDFKPQFNFVLSAKASDLQRAKAGCTGWNRPKPFETTNPHSSMSWDGTVHAVGSVGGVDSVFKKLTFSLQELAQREQDRRDSDAWLTTCRLKRAKQWEERERAKKCLRAGTDWRDPERGVEMGMERWKKEEEPVPHLPKMEEGVFLHVPQDDDANRGSREVKVDMDKLIQKKFKSTPSTQAEVRDCTTVVSPEALHQVELHFRTIDFGQVTLGSSNARNSAITNKLQHSILVELLGTGLPELLGSGPAAQVIPAGATAGFDINFKCNTEQLFRKALQYSINKSAIQQFGVVAHTIPVSLELDQDEIDLEFAEDDMEPAIKHSVLMKNNGNSSASFSWTAKGAFAVVPESGIMNPFSERRVEIIWTPQPGFKTSEVVILKVDGGQDKELLVCGHLAETRCRFIRPQKGPSKNSSGPANDKHNLVDFGQAAVGIIHTLSVSLKNVGKTKAVFFIETGPLFQVGLEVNPKSGLIEPSEVVNLSVTLHAKMELSLDGLVLCANIRGGRPAKVPLAGYACIPTVSLLEKAFEFGKVTIGASHILRATLKNEGPIPGSLQLDLSHRPEFNLIQEGSYRGKDGILDENGTARVMKPSTDQIPDKSAHEGNSNDREVSHIEAVEGEQREESNRRPQSSQRKELDPVKRKWNITVAPGDTLAFLLQYSPHQASEHVFLLPLALRGISLNERLQATVSGRGLKPTLTFSTMKVDFGDQVVNRDPCMLKQYQGEVTFRNDSIQGLSWIMDDSVLRCEEKDEKLIGVTKTPIFYISPTSGELSPGEETRLRVTFTPKSDRDYTFQLPVWLSQRQPPEGTRPYLTLEVQGFGVYPRLSFSATEVVMPVVPLSITSRALIHIVNNGFTDMEVTHSLPLHCPIDLVVRFPQGKQFGPESDQLPVELSFQSEKPVSFNSVLDFFDADGGHYPLIVTGCADNCLLTNYPFVEAYSERFQFWARDGKAVQFMDGAQIMAQEAKEFKERMSKRAKAKVRCHENGKNTSTALESEVVSPTGLKFTTNGNSSCVNDGEEYGVDLSLPAYPTGGNEEDARVLAAWLTANVVTTPIKEFPQSLIERHGAPAFEAIETMCGRRVPGQTWRRVKQRAEDRVEQLIVQYRQLLRFLTERGCLLNKVRPEALLDRLDYIRGRRLEAMGRSNGGGGLGGSQRLTPTQLREREGQWGREWESVSREAWLDVMYQSIRSFMLARVTPKALSGLPGVFISLPRAPKGHGKGKAASEDPELSDSNVYSVGEGILLKWMSYHLEQANKSAIPKRITSFSEDIRDGALLCQLVASHVPQLVEKDFPLHNFTSVYSTGALSDKSNREANASKLLLAMKEINNDIGLTTRDVLEVSSKNGVLLALHLFQSLPQMIAKTEIEFRASLGTVVQKNIELRNPGSKDITYEATLQGSQDFVLKKNQVHLKAGKEADFPVEFTPRFSSPVTARLVLWAVRANGAMAPASNMVFALK
ncbi:unnamed protein product [Choristocarpus tenellus]